MQEKQSMVVDRLTSSVEELHRTFGAWNIVWALVRSIRRQRRATNTVSHLSNRMLVDMGLPARQDPPRPEIAFHWNIRH